MHIGKGTQLAWYPPAHVALQMSLSPGISQGSCTVCLFLMTATSTDIWLSFTVSRIAISLTPTPAGGNGTSI